MYLIYLLFIFYLVLLCWLLTRIRFTRSSGIPNKIIIALFLLKVCAGLANGWINLYYYQGTDTAYFHNQGIVEYHLLFKDPKTYLLNIFYQAPGISYTSLLDTTNSFWNNLRTNIIVKMLSIFDVFSGTNYFINSLFYNFIVFFGSVALYRIFIQIFPTKKKILIITVFLLPSFLYFTSGIHRDGLLFLALAFVCYNMFHILNKEPVRLKSLLYVFIGLLFIFLLRNFIFITLVPALITWIIAEKNRKYILPIFAIGYLTFIILFFSLKFISPKLDLPGYVTLRQKDFLQLGQAGSAIPINPLFPELKSFMANAPQALNHSLLRPYLLESDNKLYIPLAIEVCVFECLFIAWLISLLAFKKTRAPAFVIFTIFFAFSVFLTIGYTVPYLGAIVRYKAVYLPFILGPLACNVKFGKRGFSHQIKKKNI